MQRLFTICISAVFFLARFGFSTEVDPTDYTLIAYELSSDEEASFNGTDGVLSEFWGAWDRDNQDKLDFVRELPSTHGNGIVPAGPEDICSGKCDCVIPGFTDGEDDAQLSVRAAYGAQGMYLYIEARDDLFVGLVATGGSYQTMSETMPNETSAYIDAAMWMNDCFDFFLDIYSSEELKEHYMANTPDYLSYSTYQYQYRFGSNEPAAQIRINYVDPTWKECAPDCWSLIFGKYSMAEAETKYKIKIETITVSANKKVQEWFMPWSNVAAGISSPNQGTKIAATFQYNDMDAPAGESPDLYDLDVLYLKNRQTPLAHKEPNATCGLPSPWGDIEFGGVLDELVPPEGGVAVTQRLRHSMGNRPTGSTACFDIAGREIPVSRRVPGTVAVLRSADGASSIALRIAR